MPNWEDEGGKHKMGILYCYLVLVVYRLIWDTDSGCEALYFCEKPTAFGIQVKNQHHLFVGSFFNGSFQRANDNSTVDSLGF